MHSAIHVRDPVRWTPGRSNRARRKRPPLQDAGELAAILDDRTPLCGRRDVAPRISRGHHRATRSALLPAEAPATARCLFGRGRPTSAVTPRREAAAAAAASTAPVPDSCRQSPATNGKLFSGSNSGNSVPNDSSRSRPSQRGDAGRPGGPVCGWDTSPQEGGAVIQPAEVPTIRSAERASQPASLRERPEHDVCMPVRRFLPAPSTTPMRAMPPLLRLVVPFCDRVFWLNFPWRRYRLLDDGDRLGRCPEFPRRHEAMTTAS